MIEFWSVASINTPAPVAGLALGGTWLKPESVVVNVVAAAAGVVITPQDIAAMTGRASFILVLSLNIETGAHRHSTAAKRTKTHNVPETI